VKNTAFHGVRERPAAASAKSTWVWKLPVTRPPPVSRDS